MHIPDGYLSPKMVLPFWVVMGFIWVGAFRKLNRTDELKSIIHLAVLSAFNFILMSFMIPLPFGTSIHLSGAALAGVLLGADAAVITISLALLTQAFLLGEGGVLAFAVNSFNLALVIPSLTHMIIKIFEKFSFKHAKILSVFLGTYLAVNCAALLCAAELGLQSMLDKSYFPYPFKITVWAILPLHLVIIGPAEALLTCIISNKIKIKG